ncbi:MAG: CBS domain-containing protein [Syntrophomonadaceae bacterium]|jgi:acetoin utilization protein AcuB|nr:CBS domain-containing protein [Syntrophomonadaceae bacterium]
MKVKDRMTTGVKTVQLDTSIAEAFRLMKDHNIRRLPVLEKEKVVGIITLTDLHQATPSTATTLSVHELNYLLAKTKIKDILPKKQKVITVTPDNYIETAAKIMRFNKISGLPVVDKEKLVGIVTETDIFDALIDILGVKRAHSRIDLLVRERPGTLAEIISLVAEAGINILNTVVYYEEKKERYRIILRLESLENDELIKKITAKGYEIESVIVKAEEDR